MIPGLASAAQFIVGKWMDSKVQMYATKWNVTKDVAISAINAEEANNKTKVAWLGAVANSRFLQVIVGGFAGPWIIYGWKVIVWDNIVHKFFWGTFGFTPPIGGEVGTWAGIILGGIFVTSTGMNVANAIINRRDK